MKKILCCSFVKVYSYNDCTIDIRGEVWRGPPKGYVKDFLDFKMNSKIIFTTRFQ